MLYVFFFFFFFVFGLNQRPPLTPSHTFLQLFPSRARPLPLNADSFDPVLWFIGSPSFPVFFFVFKDRAVLVVGVISPRIFSCL